MTPYSSRCRGLGKTFAPTSMMTQRPFAVGITVAMPGRWTHLRNFRVLRPPATTAPVLPALTRPSTFLGQELPAPEDGVVRLAAEGLARLLLHVHGDWARGRTRRGRREPGRRRQQRLRVGLVADENDRQVRHGCDGQHRPGHVRDRAVVAAHRVERDPHGLLPCFSSSTRWRRGPGSDPQLEQTRWGRTGSLHRLQYWICTGVMWWWLRRVPCLEWDVRLLGTAMTISRYFYTGIRVKTVILGRDEGESSRYPAWD